MGLNLNLNINGTKRRILAPATPTGLASVFTVDTITGTLAWTDNSGGLATYEIYSNTNGAGDVLLTTTAAGATSYNDTTCKQNASVVYKIRAKRSGLYSDYATATALVTPLCWKTDQTVRTNLVINVINVAAGKTVNLAYGDGNSVNLTGNNTNVTHTYAASATNIFNVVMTGDLNSITSFQHYLQLKSYGNIENWILSTITGINNFTVRGTMLSGDLSNKIIPGTVVVLYLYDCMFTGKIPNRAISNSMLYYRAYGNAFTGTNLTNFSTGLIEFNIKNQTAVFPIAEIDKLLKAAADWYQVNAPTANCTFDMSGANMGIPTGGASNVDLVRLAGYYTAAGFTATIVVRTS